MKYILAFSISTIILCSSFIVSADDNNEPFSASVSLKGILANVDGNKAKFNEYSDIRTDNLYGRVKLDYNRPDWDLHFDARDMGYDTQSYTLWGEMWGKGKVNLWYRELPHNITFGAVTPFSGAGGNNLTFTAPFPTDSSTWTDRFDYSTKRKELGSDISLDFLKPYFLTLTASTEQRKGIKPAGIPVATEDHDSGFALELPEPVNYRTNNLNLTAGYSQDPLFLSVGFLYNNFDNSNQTLNFQNPLSPGVTDTLTLPPNNDYYKYSLKGGLNLPFNSRISITLGRAISESDFSLLNSAFVSSVGAMVPLTLTSNTFHGKIVTTNADIVLTTNPVRYVNARIFAKYYDHDNQSDIIGTTADPSTALGAAGTMFNTPFEYRKKSFGGDFTFRLPAHFFITTGYSYVNTDRKFNFFDPALNGTVFGENRLADTIDHIYKIDLKWRATDFLSAKIGYEKLIRNALFQQDDPTSRTFDLASKSRNTYKVSIDISPIEDLSIDLGYKYKNTDYKQLTFGLLSDWRNEITTSAEYIIGKLVKVYAYGDLEKIRLDENQGSVNPTGPWRLRQKETDYDYGAGADIFLIPRKLTLKLQYDYSSSRGNADLTLTPAALAAISPDANNSNIDIGNWDNSNRSTYLVKLIYAVTRKISVAAGYMYEKFTYSDAQLNGYTLVTDPTSTTGNGAVLTGAFSNQSYTANLFFASLSYKF